MRKNECNKSGNSQSESAFFFPKDHTSSPAKFINQAEMAKITEIEFKICIDIRIIEIQENVKTNSTKLRITIKQYRN